MSRFKVKTSEITRLGYTFEYSYDTSKISNVRTFICDKFTLRILEWFNIDIGISVFSSPQDKLKKIRYFRSKRKLLKFLKKSLK